jgi:hypothetical protein
MPGSTQPLVDEFRKPENLPSSRTEVNWKRGTSDNLRTGMAT